MTPDERKEELGLNSQIQILEENLEVAEEKVAAIKDEIARWQGEQRPSQQNQVPPFQASLLGRAKQIVEKHRTRLEDFKAELRNLHAKVKARKQEEEKLEKARAAEIPKQAERIVDQVHEIDPDDLEPIFALARARKLSGRVLNAVAKLTELEIERDYLIRTKGYSIPKLADVTLPVCADELKTAWAGAFGQFWEPKRTVGSRKRASEIGQMRGELKDLAAEG